MGLLSDRFDCFLVVYYYYFVGSSVKVCIHALFGNKIVSTRRCLVLKYASPILLLLVMMLEVIES